MGNRRSNDAASHAGTRTNRIKSATALLQKVGGLGEVARDLVYRLYGICERKEWAQGALAYNCPLIAWPEIIRLAGQSPPQVQEDFFLSFASRRQQWGFTC